MGLEHMAPAEGIRRNKEHVI